jgi:mannosyltransferase
MHDTTTPLASREFAGATWWLVAILACALALRLHQLTVAPLWVDEAVTAWLVKLPPIQMFKMLKNIEMTPPLHNCLVYVWSRVFGTSELALRLPSVLFGVASVYMISRLGRILYDGRTGLLAAALLAFTPYHITYSQEGRAYSLLIFLTLWSCTLLAQLVQQTSQWRRTGYVLVTAALLYTHLYAVFVVLAQASAFLLVLALAREKPALGLRDGAILMLRVVLLYLPFMWVTAIWLRFVDDGELWITWGGWSIIGHSYRCYAGGPLLLTLLGVLAALGVRRYGFSRFGTCLSIALIVCCVVPPAVMSRFWKPFYIERYGMVALTGMLLLAAAGVALRPRPALATVALLIALMLPQAARVGSTTGWKKVDWRTLGATIDEHAEDRDVLVIDRIYAGFALDYYLQRPELYQPRGPLRNVDDLASRDPSAHIWIVLWSTAATAEQYLARAGSHYSLVRTEDYGDGCSLVELAPR